MGKPEVELRPCKTHGLTSFMPVTERKGIWYFKCRKCLYERAFTRRTQLMKEMVERAGGECTRCGYNTCQKALHFHHLDPATKINSVSNLVSSGNRAKVIAEVEKCVLLCANCHIEVESGL